MNLKKTKGYTTWSNMIARCYNKNGLAYKHYGGRGITVCAEWKTSITFLNWYNSFENTKGLELDRKDNDKGYSPLNCRLVTRNENQQNRRTPKNNTSGFRGVCLHKPSGKWRAGIRSNKKHYSLGYYDNKEDASLAYDSWIISNGTKHKLNNKALN